MFGLLFEFWYNLISTFSDKNGFLETEFEWFGRNIQIDEYLSFLASFISGVFIVILCCLFIWKMVKLIGGLIHR